MMKQVADDPQRVWYAPPFTLTTGGICRTHCNNGWMSELENAVKPYLTQMIHGHRVALGPKETKNLANWIAMKAMVFQLTTTVHPIPANHYRYLHDHRRPHPSTQVWLAARTDEEAPFSLFGLRGSYVARSQDDPERFHAYLVTIIIGNFIGEVFGHNLPFDFRLPREGKFASAVQSIWPSGGPIKWPPKHVIRSVEDFAYDRPVDDALIAAMKFQGVEVKRGDPE